MKKSFRLVLIALILFNVRSVFASAENGIDWAAVDLQNVKMISRIISPVIVPDSLKKEDGQWKKDTTPWRLGFKGKESNTSIFSCFSDQPPVDIYSVIRIEFDGQFHYLNPTLVNPDYGLNDLRDLPDLPEGKEIRYRVGCFAVPKGTIFPEYNGGNIQWQNLAPHSFMTFPNASENTKIAIGCCNRNAIGDSRHDMFEQINGHNPQAMIIHGDPVYQDRYAKFFPNTDVESMRKPYDTVLGEVEYQKMAESTPCMYAGDDHVVTNNIRPYTNKDWQDPVLQAGMQTYCESLHWQSPRDGDDHQWRMPQWCMYDLNEKVSVFLWDVRYNGSKNDDGSINVVSPEQMNAYEAFLQYCRDSHRVPLSVSPLSCLQFVEGKLDNWLLSPDQTRQYIELSLLFGAINVAGDAHCVNFQETEVTGLFTGLSQYDSPYYQGLDIAGLANTPYRFNEYLISGLSTPLGNWLPSLGGDGVDKFPDNFTITPSNGSNMQFIKRTQLHRRVPLFGIFKIDHVNQGEQFTFNIYNSSGDHVIPTHTKALPVGLLNLKIEIENLDAGHQ